MQAIHWNTPYEGPRSAYDAHIPLLVTTQAVTGMRLTHLFLKPGHGQVLFTISAQISPPSLLQAVSGMRYVEHPSVGQGPKLGLR